MLSNILANLISNYIDIINNEEYNKNSDFITKEDIEFIKKIKKLGNDLGIYSKLTDNYEIPDNLRETWQELLQRTAKENNPIQKVENVEYKQNTKEMQDKLKYYLTKTREKIDLSNQKEFGTRTNPKRPRIYLDIIHNDSGPLDRSSLHPITATQTVDKYSGLTERVETVEKHLGCTSNVSDLYERIDLIERRIIEMEEQRDGLGCSGVSSEESKVLRAASGAAKIKETMLDERIEQLKGRLLNKKE